MKRLYSCSVASHGKNKQAESHFGGDRASRTQSVYLGKGYLPRVLRVEVIEALTPRGNAVVYTLSKLLGILEVLARAVLSRVR